MMDIEKLAREAGIQDPEMYTGDPDATVPWIASTDDLRRFAALVAEACIETVYDATDWAHEETDLSLKEIIANAIRERFKAS